MPSYKIQILYDEHLKRFFYLENRNENEPKGRKHCKRQDKISWKTEGDFAATVDFGQGETPFMVSKVEVPKNGQSRDEEVIAKPGHFKYDVIKDTGEKDDPELIVDPK